MMYLQEVSERDLADVSPLKHGHVIPNGTYRFDQEESPLALESIYARLLLAGRFTPSHKNAATVFVKTPASRTVFQLFHRS